MQLWVELPCSVVVLLKAIKIEEKLYNHWPLSNKGAGEFGLYFSTTYFSMD